MSEVQTPELRAEKYDTKDREQMAKSGEAMPDGSYPIKDQEDLENAIHAVGRGNADHDAIRKHIIARAKALGHSDLIPDNWAADGSLKQQNAAATPLARRKKERHRAVPLLPEVRFFNTEQIEIREADTVGNLVALHGLVIRYGVAYEVHDRAGVFEEKMAPGVAQDVLDGDTRFLFNHDGMPLARTAAGTMTLEDTPEGLWVDPILDIRMQLANDLVIATERGDINQMSVGFLTKEDDWNARKDQRTVLRFKAMPDVSAVTYPASPTTTLDLAHRMAAQMLAGDERARVRRVFMDVKGLDIRAGKVLSAANAEAIGNAIKTLHGVYDGAGLDINSLMEPDEVVDDSTESAEMPDDAAFGDSGSEGDGAGPNMRQTDPGEPVDQRADPSAQDESLTMDLPHVKAAIAHLKATQLADPDNGADPRDKAVSAALDAADAAIDDAIRAQSADNDSDRTARSIIELRARASELRGRRRKIAA